MEQDNRTTLDAPVSIPIIYKYTNETALRYANQVSVNGSEHDVVISFFQSAFQMQQSQPDPDAIKKLVESGVDAECVARIVVSQSFYPILVEVLKRNVRRLDKEQLQAMLSQLIDESEQTQ